MKPINMGNYLELLALFKCKTILDALTTWVGKIPADVVEKMAEIAPMLRTLGKAMKVERRRQGHLDHQNSGHE